MTCGTGRMTTPQVEKLLNELKKFPENKECVNCLSVSRVGHGNICVPFGTFVCSDCKSAHQAFSHRIKSVTMSIWTKDDVDKLQPERGGSNDNARRKYFARYDDRRLPRPQKGDDHTVWKDFIKQVYIDKRFYDDARDDDDDWRGNHGRSDVNRRRDMDETSRSVGRPTRDSGRSGRHDNDYDDSYRRQTSRDQPRSRRYDDDDELDSPRESGRGDSHDRHADRPSSRRHDDYSGSRDPYDERHGDHPSSRRHDDHGGSRDADDGDDEVRMRRKDRGAAPRTAAPRAARGEARAKPAISSGSNANVDLLGHFTAPSDGGLAKQMAAMTVSAEDDWGSFDGPSSQSAPPPQPANQQADLFSTAHVPKASFPLPDILSMYSGAPARPQPMGMQGMGMPAPMATPGAMGMAPVSGMIAPVGMGGMGMNPAMRPMGMQGMGYGMAGMPQQHAPMGMDLSAGFNKPMGMGRGMMPQAKMPMAARAPAPMYSGLGINTMAASNQASVFDRFGTAGTPNKGATNQGQQKPKQDTGKFNDLRW